MPIRSPMLRACCCWRSPSSRAVVRRRPSPLDLMSDEMVEGMIQGKRVEGVLLGVGPPAGSNCWAATDGCGRSIRIRPARSTKTASRFRPYPPSEFRDGVAAGIGRRVRSERNEPLPDHPSARTAEPVGRAFRGSLPLLHSLLLGARFRARDAGVSVGGHRLRESRASSIVSRRRNVGTSAGVLGYYDRMLEPDHAVRHGRHGNSANWHRNAAVLIHEATHQMAFNTGIHSRYAPPPDWVAEGLATHVRGARRVRLAQPHADGRSRESGSAAGFRQVVAPRHRPEVLASIVASDDLFHVNPAAAYAEAWALTFFLVETEPRKYAEYLKRTASRPPFQKLHGGGANGRLHGRLRRRLADAGGPIPAIHGGGEVERPPAPKPCYAAPESFTLATRPRSDSRPSRMSAGAAGSRGRTDRPAAARPRRCGLRGGRRTARRRSRRRRPR